MRLEIFEKKKRGAEENEGKGGEMRISDQVDLALQKLSVQVSVVDSYE